MASARHAIGISLIKSFWRAIFVEIQHFRESETTNATAVFTLQRRCLDGTGARRRFKEFLYLLENEPFLHRILSSN